MRVLHVQKAKGIGGSERHLLSLLPGLAEAGVDVRICVAAAGRAQDFTAELEARGVAFSTTPAGPDLNPLLLAALRREIRGFRPDLVHTHLIHADLHGQAAARLTGVPGVSSIHSAHRFYGREPYRSAARLAGRSARRTIAISEHVGRYVEELKLARPGAVRVVHYGVDANGWAASAVARQQARAKLGLAADEIAVGAASRLIPHKGHSLLLRAFAKARQTNPHLRLLIAGDGPLRAELEREAARLGDAVRFLGFVADIQEFLSACDVLAFTTQPELSEGFGLAALEAMAAGCPVVASDLASLPEVVGTGEEAGLLFDPADADALAAALARLAGDADLRGRLGEGARARAISRFSLAAMVERTVAVYDEALQAAS